MVALWCEIQITDTGFDMTLLETLVRCIGCHSRVHSLNSGLKVFGSTQAIGTNELPKMQIAMK